MCHIRAATKTLGVAADFLNSHDLHIHVPAGAIPKDGPSAGVTMATAIVSALKNQTVREDVAMTGEITLSGLVLPVGGIREKALAARRHGIKTLVLPARNEPDLAELSPEVKQSLRFVPVETLEQVLAATGPLSELIQHEMDHLDGVLAIDRALDKSSLCTREEWKRRYATHRRAASPRSVPIRD